MFEVLETIRGGGCKAAMVTNTHTIELMDVISICRSEHCFDITVISKRLVSRSPPEGYSRLHWTDSRSKPKTRLWLATGLTKILSEQTELV